MTGPSSARKIIKEKIHKITILKYIIIIVIAFAGGGILFFAAPPKDSQLKLLAETVLYSGIGAFLLSLLNDILLKSEANELAKLDRLELAEEFARELFTTHADAMVTEESFGQLMESESRRSAVFRSLAGLITQDSDLRPTLEQSYLEPLHRPPHFRSVKAISTLKDYDAATGKYCWSFRQTMETLRPIEHFRVFACSDSDVAAKIESSSRATDFVVLLSGNPDHNTMRNWLKDNLIFRVSLTDPKSKRVERLDPTMAFDMEELRSNVGCEDIEDKDGAYCKVSWNSDSSNLMLDLRFKIELSLKDDPYFFWDLQDYAFIDSIEIDYADLLGHCGRTSIVPHIRNPGCHIEHDRSKGLLRLLVGGMAGPGEGVVLIFRP
ncbi:MAG TPA: hypothetical protein VEA60_14520 [Allosphingosinicella sp.]|nr:hypothetical protein [Allosphingosinicella sp.]